MALIEGGYYIKARCIQESEIAHAPPHVREIWDWLIKECNHEDKKHSGIIIKRGQCVRSYFDIIDGLHWMVGWRKMSYSKHDCETAMKWLKKRTMITTTKTTRGMIITVLNYDRYQNPKNYENHTKTTQQTTEVPHYKQEWKEIKNKYKKISYCNFPLKSGEYYMPSEDFILSLHENNPLVDFKLEFQKIHTWCLANEAKRKTQRGAKKFLNSWISGANEKLRQSGVQQNQPKYYDQNNIAELNS